jgi:predicted phosphodiesterase
MTIIGLISDIHGNLPALEAVMIDFARRGITDVVNLGDHASAPLWPRETVALLMQQPWIQISGNHDRQVAHDPTASHGAADRYAYQQLTTDQRAWLGARPATAMHPAGVLLCHGTPTSDLEFLIEEVAADRFRLMPLEKISARLGESSAPVACCGHSHVPRAVRAGPALVVNPGSVGLQAFSDSGPPSYRCETGAPHARYAVLTEVAGRWSVEHIAVEYDWERSARRAEENGSPAIAHALRTGFAFLG